MGNFFCPLPILDVMAPPKIPALQWHVVNPSWTYTYGFSAEEVDRALEEKPDLRKIFDTVQRAAKDPASIIYQLLRLASHHRPVKFFLHEECTADISGSYLFEVGAHPFSGIHLCGNNAVLDGQPTTDPMSLRRSLTHELWHLILWRRFAPTDLGELIDRFRESSLAAYVNTDYREAAFEEGFAAMCGLQSVRRESVVDRRGPGRYFFSNKDATGMWQFGGPGAVLPIGALDCLYDIAAARPGMWKTMAATVLRHGGRMDLPTFLAHFVDDHPDLAPLIPAQCHSSAPSTVGQ